MVQLWANAGEINKQTEWTAYNPNRENYMIFTLPDAHMNEGQFGRDHHVAFWDKIDREFVEK